jgi:hypothetical protein
VSLGIDLLWPEIALARTLYFVAIGLIVSVFLTAESYRRVNAFVHAKRTRTFLKHADCDDEADALKGFGEHPALKLLGSNQFDSLPSLTWSDLSTRIKAGSKLLVISGVVLDVRPFLGAHPGGRIVLEDSLGTDSTAAFFGVDPEAPFTHAHSSFAWTKLREMAVATLRPEGDQADPGIRGSVDLVGGKSATNAAARARRLNALLAERRVQSKPLAGEAAHYRRYRIVSKETIAKNVIRLKFEQINGVHPRPFVWEEYVSERHKSRSCTLIDTELISFLNLLFSFLVCSFLRRHSLAFGSLHRR